ncbi:putative urea ABC transporter substrate-binding protein [Pseudomonas sp.]|uniref:putative urea ABC transporter substrate-binding protein n=1 Tax=Pseudomonas sp. TaxID=306 RepID=UPI003A977689
MRKYRLLSFAAAGLAAVLSFSAHAEKKDSFSVCWTLYAGWMPWGHASTSGIIDKWAKKYGIDIDVVQLNDYVESINQYSVGQFDGCTMTNMDALTIPAAGGVDSTALIVGDYSNGNDGLLIKGEGKTLADIKGMQVNLVELSVSHYFLARALESAGMSERDVTVVNTSDADIIAAYTTSSVQAAATWNPMLAEIVAQPGSTQVFDSSKIPGEILDMMVVNTQTLQDNPDFGKALVGAWFEILELMQSGTPEATEALTEMAKASGTDLAGYQAQLATTKLFYTPKQTLDFVTSPALPETMTKVANFSFEHGILGEGARSADAIGMTFAGGVSTGDSANIKLRFDPSYIEMAVDGKL